MRDTNGSGNIYFDDLFADGIPTGSFVFYCANFIIGFVNLTVAPVFFYMACLKQSFHRNLRLVTTNLYLAFFLTGVGDTVYSILVLSRTSDRQYDQIFLLFRFIQAMGTGLWKTTFLSIILERTAATIYRKNYENKPHLFLGLTLYFFGFLGILLTFGYYILLLRAWFFFGIYFSCNLVCLLSIFVLFWVNKKMRKIEWDASVQLSLRYQITENVRFLRIMTPLITLGCFVDLFGFIGVSVEVATNFDNQLLYPFLMITVNTFGPIFYLLYLKLDKKMRMKIVKFLCCCHQIKVEPANIVQIRNVIDEPLIIQDDAQFHFRQLAEYWK